MHNDLPAQIPVVKTLASWLDGSLIGICLQLRCVQSFRSAADPFPSAAQEMPLLYDEYAPRLGK